MNDINGMNVAGRQDPLRELYQHEPEAALITDRACTRGGTDTDPFHGWVGLGDPALGTELHFGIHQAVGGFSDAPNPGDLLCGALAACLDATLRVIANRLGITLHQLEVAVTAEVDTRGTLLVARDVPVGFKRIACEVRLRPADDIDDVLLNSLIEAAEHSCVNLQTLLGGITVDTQVTQL